MTQFMTRDQYQQHTRQLLGQFGDLQNFIEKLLGKQFRQNILQTFATLLLAWEVKFEEMLQGPKQQETFETIGRFFYALLDPMRSDRFQRAVEALPGGVQFTDLMIRTTLFFDHTLRQGIGHLNPRQQEEVGLLAHHLLVLIHPVSDEERRQHVEDGIHTIQVSALCETHAGLPILEALAESPLPEGALKTALVMIAAFPQRDSVDAAHDWARRSGALRGPDEPQVERPVGRTEMVTTLKPK